MADEVALMEQAELEALMNEQHEPVQPMAEENMDATLFDMCDRDSKTISTREQRQRPDTLYGSDDDEYDNIFMDVIQEEQRLATHSSQATEGDHDMMDMD
jgi:hypothetical protein